MFNQQKSAQSEVKCVAMVVMSGANQLGCAVGTTCHLSPVIRHESSQTFEETQHCKTTPSWKDTQ